MSCEIPAEVLEYIELVESGQPRACPEQHALVALVRRAFETENLRVETERLEKYLGLQKYFPFALFPWEKFLFTLWNCTYTAQGRPRWKTVLCIVGRGAGKDGYIAFDSACSISPYNPVSHYNVDICAMNEDQATQPSRDLVEVLELPKYEAKLNKHYYHTKEIIQGRKNRGVMKGRTNNPQRPGRHALGQDHLQRGSRL